MEQFVFYTMNQRGGGGGGGTHLFPLPMAVTQAHGLQMN